MKYYHQSKRYLIAVTLILITLSSYSQEDKNFHFGLHFSPNVGWMMPETKNFDAGSNRLGYSFGLIGDFKLGNSASFNVGLSVTTLSHEIVLDSITTKPGAPSLKTNYNVKYDYDIKYLEIPLTLKLRTNEIGYVTYWGQFGFAPGVVYRAKADIDPDIFNDPEQSTDRSVNADGDDFAETSSFREDNITSLRASLLVGAGIEYRLAGTTSLLMGIQFNNGLTNALAADGTTGFNSYISLNLGVMF